jgi:hypothetical protein
MRNVCLCLAVLAMVGIGDAATVSRHQAKTRTFAYMLRQTEKVPDSIDVTQAAITVGQCHRINAGMRCETTLDPVLDSGLLTRECFTVDVYPHSTKARPATCANLPETPILSILGSFSADR